MECNAERILGCPRLASLSAANDAKFNIASSPLFHYFSRLWGWSLEMTTIKRFLCLLCLFMAIQPLQMFDNLHQRDFVIQQFVYAGGFGGAAQLDFAMTAKADDARFRESYATLLDELTLFKSARAEID